LAIFLGGLALGAGISGRLADRMRAKSLTAYGLVELAVGVLAPIVSQFILLSPQLFVSLLNGLPENSTALLTCRLSISMAALFVPTVLMGASLPLLTRFLAEKEMKAAEFFSHLYGVNTLGGVFGCLFACFVGFPYLGLIETIWFAAGINVVVGLSSIVIGKSQVSAADSSGTESGGAVVETQKEESTVTKTGAHRQLLCLYLIAGLTGFTALSYEVLWTRMLKFATTSSTYAFTATVSMFLIGLAVGSFLYHRLFAGNLRQSVDELLGKFALFQYLTAMACTPSLLYLPLSFLLFLSRLANPPRLFGGMISDQLSGIMVLGGTTFLFMFVPATLIGISFPMITSLSTALTKNVSTAVGNAFAANTVGCVLGSAMVGLVLVPNIGSNLAFQITILETVLTGAFSVAISQSMAKKNKLAFTVVPVALALLMAIFVRIPFQSFLSQVDVLRFGEDAAGTVFVLDWHDHKQLFMNGEAYSTTTMRGRRYMRLLGHLPALLHSNPEEALVICFGMGTTAGAVSLHPELKRLDIAELSPLVIQVAPLFTDTNYKVLSNPKVHVHVDDGRNFLLRTKERYDFITLEPPPPSDAGMTNLYSKEFYALMRQRLKPGGLVCQWIPMHATSGSLWKMMVKAAQEEFPEVSVWESNNSECVMICATAPIKLDLKKLQVRMASPSVHESLVDVGLGGPSDLLSTYISSGSTLKNFVKDAPPIADDRAQIEFYLPYGDRRFYNFDLNSIVRPVNDLLSDADANESQQFKQASQSIRLMREATQLWVRGDHAKAESLLKQAAAMEPKNEFFRYAEAHPEQAVN
jgi:predicted membrane-bound spermidine synthase